ncbi:MAG: VOC family protein [Lautropia sp.]|nr:VOC family protein [Lautropia sp.]
MTQRFSAPHVGVSVPDLDAAIEWYTTVLGMRLLAGPIEIREDSSPLSEVSAAIYGAGFERWRFAHLATPDDVGYELFEFEKPKTAPRANNFEYWVAGYHHVGLTAPDIDDAVKRIVGAGGRARTKVLTVDAERGYRIVYLEDPWGTVLELCSHPYVEMWGGQEGG